MRSGVRKPRNKDPEFSDLERALFVAWLAGNQLSTYSKPRYCVPMINDILITGARILDGTGALPVADRAILVENGRISRIDSEISVEGIRTIDAAGATVMPGLIDAHVHLESVPGSYYRDDSDEQLWEFRKHQLRAYPACGVTTVLDNGISSRQLREFQEYMKSGGVGPRIFALGPIFYPPGGYGDAVKMPHWGPFRSSGSAKDVESLFAEYDDLDDIIGAKMTLEPGVGPSRIWPIHTPEMRAIITREAGKRGLPIHVHALKLREQLIALEMDPYCLAHPGFFQGSPTRSFIDEVKRRGMFVMTTLASTVGQNLVMFNLDQLDDPLLELVVPQEQLNTARDPEAWKATMLKLFKICSPGWMPSFLIRLMLKLVNMEKQLTAQLASAGNAVCMMHEAGIPIVAGTDSANWPLFLNYFHGPSMILELELLCKAGMAPIDVISSATRIPAEMMRKSDELGTVETGKRADLIIVEGDPLEDIRVLRKISWSIKDGEARTPREWIEA